MRFASVILSWLYCVSICHGYRFLGMFPFAGKSHFIMFEHLMKGLANRGHQVDMVSTFPLKKPYDNYTDIVKLKSNLDLVNNMSYERMNAIIGTNTVYAVASLAGNNVCEYLGDPDVQKLIRDPPKNPPYDAVFIEIFGAHCFGIIGHLFNIPVIGVSTTGLYPWMHPMVANPENIAFVPNNCVSFPDRMNFWQRIYNFVHTIFLKFYYYYLTAVQDDIIRQYVGPNMPTVRELEKNVALILVNSHISLNGITSMTPAIVEVGGLHVQDEDLTLQPELEKWMNDSKDGFVYFTFGSMVKIETFPREFLNVLYKSLSKIAPVRVLMKIPNPENLPANLPKNIYTLPWMPQLKILKHPNIRAFITHGGLMGTQEAVACGVPMIGIPLFADQFMNIDRYVSKNIAIRIDLDKMTMKNMDAALNAILHDPKYRDTARNLSIKFLDRPFDSLDIANYWVEYVIKYGSKSLRSPAMDLTWWQLNLIDVSVFLLLCTAIVISIIVFIVYHLIEMTNQNHQSPSRLKKIN